MGSLRAGPRSDGPEPRQAGTLLVLHAGARASVRDSRTRVVREPGLVAARALDIPSTARHTLWARKFTEPVALSSTQPTDLPLPRRAFRLSFDLLALRARCEREPMGQCRRGQARRSSDCRTLRVSSDQSEGRAGTPRWSTAASSEPGDESVDPLRSLEAFAGALRLSFSSVFRGVCRRRGLDSRVEGGLPRVTCAVRNVICPDALVRSPL